MKTAIVTDSTAYIPEHIRKQEEIFMLPLTVQLGGQTYREEIDITAEQFYQLAETSVDFPQSSQPAVGEIYKLFQELSQEYDAIISIHLSSGISGTYQTVSSLKEEFPGCPIYPYDSGISCTPQARLVLEAARLAQKGMEAEHIVRCLNRLRERTHAYFMVDNLKNLQRGGRLSLTSATLGTMLKVKPVLHFRDKKIVVFEKIRTQKKALKRVEELLQETMEEASYPLIATVIHANVPEQGIVWMEELKSRYPDVRFELSYFGPVIGTHLGEGALGLTWTEDAARSQS